MNEAMHNESLLACTTFKKYRHSRNVKIIIKSAHSILVTGPYFVSYSQMKDFLLSKKEWVMTQIHNTLNNSESGSLMMKGGSEEYLALKNDCYNLALSKVAQWNTIYKFNYNKIIIRNQTTRWGSCSSRGTLSFNYRIIKLPDHLIDYLVVHELCHLKEMNHSDRFWKLVGETIPDYKVLRKELRTLS
jgi:predicted metal-dependent hydrolase